MIKVVAAIIKRKDLYLIARRAKHKDHAGKWEFPGGKIDSNESPEKALERELFEEFGVLTKTGHHLATNRHDYGSFQIELMAYQVDHLEGDFRLTDHDELAWVHLKDLAKYELSEADIGIWKTLAASL